MSDPMTAGTVIASVLAMGAEAVMKSFVGEAAKDAYKKLKQEISRWARIDVAALEANPASAARQAVVAESVDRLVESDRQILARLADELAAHLEAKSGPVGLDVERLEAVRVKLQNITAQSGTGTRFGTIVTDSFEVDGVRVGLPGKI